MQPTQEADTTGQENLSTSQEQPLKEPKSKLDKVKALLEGGQDVVDDLEAQEETPDEPSHEPDSDSGVDVDSGADSGVPDATPAPLTVAEIAEKLDIGIETLYGMSIPIGGDEVLTLGKLKDAYKGQTQAAQEVATKAAALDDREAGLASDIQALGVLDAMQQVPAEIRGQAVNWLNQSAQAEYGKFLDLVPELKDDATRIAYEKDADALLAEYGIIPQQLGVRTAGMHRFVRDFVKAKKSLAALTAPTAKKAPKPVKKSRPAAPVGSAEALAAKARQTGDRKDRVAAVRAILGG